MQIEDFTSFERGRPQPYEWVVVTNNIEAVNAHGQMSHVWLTSNIIYPDNGDKPVMFTDSNSQVHGLTHWKYV